MNKIWYGVFDGVVTAFILDSCHGNRVDSYQHIGQHSEASVDFMLECRPARREEYQNLEKELRANWYYPNHTVVNHG